MLFLIVQDIPVYTVEEKEYQSYSSMESAHVRDMQGDLYLLSLSYVILLVMESYICI